MGKSQVFGQYTPRLLHLLRGRNGVAGEVLELRDDVDAAFYTLEQTGATSSILTTPKTVYVDSVAGNDANTGTASAPFATLARAVADRFRYSDLKALYQIQLKGLGPYTLPGIYGSLASENGFFVICGDPAVIETRASGTLTDAISDFVFTTSATLGGIDVHRGDFFKLTSGASAGGTVQIYKNTNNTISIQTLNFLDESTVAGNTFQIIRPRTRVIITNAVSGFFGCRGVGVAGGLPIVRHVLKDLQLEGGTGAIQESNVAMVTVRSSASFSLQHSRLLFGLPVTLAPPYAFSLATYAAGYTSTASTGIAVKGGNELIGCYFYIGGVDAVVSSGNSNSLAFEALVVLGQLYIGDHSTVLALSCFSTGPWFFVGGASIVLGFCEWEVAIGDCILVSSGTTLDLSGPQLGGTANGCALICLTGARAIFRVDPSTFTGSNPSADFKTDTASFTRADLAAVPSAVTDPMPFGSVICRIS